MYVDRLSRAGCCHAGGLRPTPWPNAQQRRVGAPPNDGRLRLRSLLRFGGAVRSPRPLPRLGAAVCRWRCRCRGRAHIRNQTSPPLSQTQRAGPRPPVLPVWNAAAARDRLRRCRSRTVVPPSAGSPVPAWPRAPPLSRLWLRGHEEGTENSKRGQETNQKIQKPPSSFRYNSRFRGATIIGSFAAAAALGSFAGSAAATWIAATAASEREFNYAVLLGCVIKCAELVFVCPTRGQKIHICPPPPHKCSIL